VANGLRALAAASSSPPGDLHTAKLLVGSTISSAGYAIRAALHQTMKISHRALVVFHRDMFFLKILIFTCYYRIDKH